MDEDLIMSTKHIPFDLISDNILPRVPAESLLRFTSVCKSWYTFIKSPRFFAAHLQYYKVKGKHPLILGEDSCYVVENQDLVLFAPLDDPFVKSLVYYKDSAESCNGLISILHDDHTSKILLWNPSIRKCKTVYTYDDYETTSEVFGLGFHESSNEHRVVRILYLDFTAQYVEVYNLGTDSWHLINSIPSRFINNRGGYFHERGVYLNGCIHWISTKLEMQDSYSIVLFDFETELFSEMAPPKEVNDIGYVSFVSVQNFGGSLAVLYHDDRSSDESCEVWNMIKMTEYGVNQSWTKKYSVRLPKNSNLPVGFTKDGMLIYNEESDLQSPNYTFADFMTSESKYVEGCGKYINVIDYMESLALL